MTKNKYDDGHSAGDDNYDYIVECIDIISMQPRGLTYTWSFFCCKFEKKKKLIEKN